MATLQAPGAETGDKLTARDWRLILIAAVVAAISLGVAGRYFHRAFPEAAIDFQVSGPGSAPIAQRFLQARGWALAGFHHAEQFDYDDQAKTFLERQLGLQRADQLLRTRIRLWRWENRWFQPLHREEYDVGVAPTGAVVAFDHEIPAAAPGANLTQDQARQLALNFLRQVMHLNPEAWVAEGAARQVRSHRTDYTFTWKDAAPLEPAGTPGVGAYVAQAEYRHVVTVQGNEVGAYDEYLKVPDAWQRSYARLRSKNNDAGLVDSGLILVLFVALLFILVSRLRRGAIRWRAALWVGGAGAVLSFLASLNAMGQDLFAYNTTQSWSAFLAGSLFSYLASAVGVGVFFVVLTAAAEALYRERFPSHVAVASFLSWRGFRSKAFLLSMVLGLSLAAFFFAYQTVFYLIANHFGAWAPADVPYDSLLNTRLPWAFVLFSGFFPAISEEFGFRMFAIPLLEKWFRYLWVAVIAASFVWGFGHATYPNQPFYIRGLEVGLGGVLLSWIMIRFGILTTVVWHYTVDALYTAMLLLRAHDAYLLWSGAVTAFLAVAPLLLAAVLYWRHHGFAPQAALTNAALAAPAPAAAMAAVAPEPVAASVAPAAAEISATAEGTHCVSISGPNWTAGLLIAAILLSAYAVPLRSWKSVLPWRTDRAHAIAGAQHFLQQQGYRLAGYQAGAVLASAAASRHGAGNQVAAAQIFSTRGQGALQRAFSQTVPAIAAAYWEVRFFRPLQQEEYEVAVRPDTGQVIAFSHTLPETAPGASPALAQAQGDAAAFLQSQGLSTAGLALKVATQQKRPARTDSRFIWQGPAPGAGPAAAPAYRLEADLAGGTVSYFAAWYHVPQARVLAYERTTLSGVLLGVAHGLLLAAMVALVVYLLVLFARRRDLSWATPLKIAIAAGLITLALSANGMPAAASAYPTSIPWGAFLLSLGIGVLIAGLGAFLLTLVLVAPLAITAPQAAALTLAITRRRLERETAWDAVWVGLFSLAWVAGWDRVRAVVNARWFSAGAPAWPSPPAGLAALVPGLGDGLGALLYAVWIAAFLGLVLPILCRAWRDPKRRSWAIGAVALTWIGILPAVHHPAQFAQAGLLAAFEIALLLAFAALFLRRSPLAYLSATLVPALVIPGINWLGLPLGTATLAGCVLIGLAVTWLGGLALVSRTQ